MNDTTPLTEASVMAPGPGTRVRNFRGRLLVGRADLAVQLEDVGALVWRSVDGSRTAAEIGAVVAAEYDVTADVAVPDVVELLEELAASGLVVRVS